MLSKDITRRGFLERGALALGATLYLPKPVLRRQFIGALDQTLALIEPAA